MSSRWLNDRRRNVTSQNGEDGVIEAIFNRIGAVNGWACEFGAGDGVTFSNTKSLIDRGWKAVLIESLDTTKLRETYRDRVKEGLVFVYEVAVRPSGEFSLASILVKTVIPKEFDFLSIDVDGEDIEIWRGLTDYEPRVVMIEVNSLIPPGKRKEVETEGSLGCSIEAVVELGKQKGYELALHTGNAIFVRRDLAKLLNVDPDNWQELFDWTWIGFGG